jgi:6-phosphogluconate dehydrogenase (decarboxylating)
MQLGMVGLGRMGGNMTLRCLADGHHMVVYDQHAETVASYVAQGAAGAASIADLISQLSPPRAAWIMLPAGDVTETAVMDISTQLQPGDIVIDGGNSMFKKDDVSAYSGWVEDSGEGRWTIQAAIEEAVLVDVLSASLYARFRSRQAHTYADKLLSAMRDKFGGHVEPRSIL